MVNINGLEEINGENTIGHLVLTCRAPSRVPVRRSTPQAPTCTRVKTDDRTYVKPSPAEASTDKE